MSQFKIAIALGAALLPTYSLAQSTPPVALPPVNVDAVPKKAVPAPAPAATTVTTLPATAGPPAEAQRSDLNPDSPTNPMRMTRSNTGHTETITRKQIEELRPRDVFDLVNNAGGVIATQGGRKGFSGLLVRGDNNFVWILDGAYLERTTASRIMRSIPVNVIEEVTVVRGSAALTLAPLVGSAAPGGAPVDGFIVVRTRKPKQQEAEVRGAVESNNTFQAGLWAGSTFRKGSVEGYVATSISKSASDGPKDRLDNGATYNVDYENATGIAKAGIDVAGWSFNFLAYRGEGTFGIPNANSHGPGQGSWYMKPADTVMLIFNGSKTWSPVHTTLFNVSRIESEQSLWTANTPAGPYTENYNPNYITHVNLRHNVDLNSLRFAFGGDFRSWNAPNGQQYYEGIQREEETYGGFAQVEKRFWGDRLTFDAALRYDRVNVLHGLDYYTGGAQPFGGVNSPLRTTNVMQPLAKFYDFGTSFRVTDDWKLTGRVGTSQQGTSGLLAVPGVVLGEDSQMKVEVGAEGRINRWFNPAINLFHRAVQNEKTLAGYTYVATNNSTQTCRAGVIPTSGALSPKNTSALTPCYNQADTTRQGIEITIGGQLWPGGSYRANYTHFTNLENAESITPHNMAGLSLQQQIGDYQVTGTVKYVDPYKGAATDANAWLGGYTRFDAGVSKDFRFNTTLVRATLYGRNLTDQRYETTNGIQDVGRVIGFEALTKF